VGEDRDDQDPAGSQDASGLCQRARRVLHELRPEHEGHEIEACAPHGKLTRVPGDEGRALRPASGRGLRPAEHGKRPIDANDTPAAALELEGVAASPAREIERPSWRFAQKRKDRLLLQPVGEPPDRRVVPGVIARGVARGAEW
jgi:hypothetical protein